MEHYSERATTYGEAERLVEAYRLFAMPARYLVSAGNWEMDPRGDPAWATQAQRELVNFGRAPNGMTEFEIGDRYQLAEPFDIEFNHTGFVVWTAANVLIAREVHAGGGGPQFVAPRTEETHYGATLGPAGGEESHHEHPEPPSEAFLEAVERGAPIVGLLECGQFPLIKHGWGRAEIDVRFPPVTVELW